jgi:hypothetical protein
MTAGLLYFPVNSARVGVGRLVVRLMARFAADQSPPGGSSDRFRVPLDPS